MASQSTPEPLAQKAAAPVDRKNPAYGWIPIRSLGPRHRPRVLDHLLALGEADRYLRFGHAATDAQIAQYVDRIDFGRDEVFGIFNRRLELVALAHLAFHGDGERPLAAEFGVSVLPRARQRGFGARLFAHAALHARVRSVDTLIVHALSENAAMLRMARHAGAEVERMGPEAEAVLKLPPEDMAAHVEAIVGAHAAEIDYGLKVHARHVDRLLEMIGEIRDGVRAARHRSGT